MVKILRLRGTAELRSNGDAHYMHIGHMAFHLETGDLCDMSDLVGSCVIRCFPEAMALYIEWKASCLLAVYDRDGRRVYDRNTQRRRE